MSNDDHTEEELAHFTEEGRLKHEIKFLQERVNNLESFKKKFFVLNSDLIRAREKMALYEEQLSLAELKKRIVGLPDIQPDELTSNEDVLEFFEDSLLAESYQDLVMSIFQSLDEMGLQVAIQITNGKERFSYALDEGHKKNNIQLIEKHRDQGEVIEHDNYIVINEEYISLIANNLPVNDSKKNKQTKKYLKLISIGANARIHGLTNELELDKLRDNIYKIFRMTHQSFDSMRNNMDEQTIAISTLFVEMRENVKETMAHMELSEDYLKLVAMIFEDTRTELNLLLTSGLTFDDRFLETIKKLEKAYSPKSANK